MYNMHSISNFRGIPAGAEGKESAFKAGDLGSIPGSGRSPEEKSKSKSFSQVWLFVTPWTVGGQTPPSMEFSRPEYCSG